MKIVIASGKGGVGKSMVAASLSLLFSKEAKVVACDCDVDTPSLGLWLGVRRYEKTQKISTSEKAFILKEKCIGCGKCMEICGFDAIQKKKGFEVNPLLCEGCGACQLVCPADAILIKTVSDGEVRVTQTKYGFPLISGKLYAGEKGSGRIVEILKKKVEEFSHDVAVLDAPAGIGCPVIASLRGSDFILLVTEPMPSALSDLRRILKIVNHFQIPYGIVINKWDVHPKFSRKIEKLYGDRILGRVRYDEKVMECILNLKPVVSCESGAARDIRCVYQRLKSEMIGFKFEKR